MAVHYRFANRGGGTVLFVRWSSHQNVLMITGGSNKVAVTKLKEGSSALK